ncbi:MAG: HlyD family efflux transporter periplasmic adaptor subunit [Bacteroidota bacterium]
MDQVIDNSLQRKNRLKQIGRILLIVAVLVAGFFLLRNVLKTTVDTSKFRTAKVELGMMENAITATGLVVPTFEQQVNAAVNSEIKSVYLTSGAEVKQGDLILELDEEFTQLEFESLKDEVELRKNNITKLRLEYDKNLKELDYENQIKTLELSSLQAQLSDKKRLKDIGGATQEEVEQAELTLKIAQLEQKKLKNELEFKKNSITSDRRNLELEMMIQEKKLRELRKKLTQTKVAAPRDGVITYVKEDIGLKITEGDVLVRLANLDAFRVEASCSDRYANIVQVGLPVRVRINRKDLAGRITSILPAIENNAISFITELEDKSNANLRPDMRVEVFIISDRKEQVLKVKSGPAFRGGVQQPVFVVRGEQAFKQTIKVGLTNMDYVEVQGGLEEGDRIIISDMKEYEHLDMVELK